MIILVRLLQNLQIIKFFFIIYIYYDNYLYISRALLWSATPRISLDNLAEFKISDLKVWTGRRPARSREHPHWTGISYVLSKLSSKFYKSDVCIEGMFYQVNPVPTPVGLLEL